MMDFPRLNDGFSLEMMRTREKFDGMAVLGKFQVELFDERGRLKHREEGHNLITDAGDLYIAQMVIALVAPANAAQPTKMTGMKLGTGVTAYSKAGAGAALVTYKTASNVAFDASYPQTTNLGSTLGVTAVYKTTWNAGVATDAALAEAVIVNDSVTNATTSAANTISRITYTPVNKGASDTLAITWSHKFLGA
jgi:hypothetical protein